MTTLWIHDPITNEPMEVGKDVALPVSIIDTPYLPPMAGQTITRMVKVPGIGTAAAYQAADAFGTLITFPDVFRTEKMSGEIRSVFFVDLDDEGIAKSMPLFTRPITVTADNGAMALDDADGMFCCGAVAITAFVDCGGFQVGYANNVGLRIKGEGVNLYSQLQTGGADTIAVGKEPWIAIVVCPD